MKLSELRPAKGMKHKAIRKGRGHGSGKGKTSGKGHKGQRARSGPTRPGFEGGQMPLYMRLPKRGFKCRNSKDIVIVNIDSLNIFEDGDVVDIDSLMSKRLINQVRDGVKILGNGELNKKLTVKANYFSKSAADKIKDAGGSTEVI